MLTTEQKINLLILAGFSPGVHAVERFPMGVAEYPRIWKGVSALTRNNGERWKLYHTITYGTMWEPAAWESLGIDSIPDELIYEACDGAHN